MLHKVTEDLIGLGNNLFSNRQPLMSLWQEIAENFYPQRADFITQRFIGADFASNLTTSVPVLMHRELSDTINSMLRPRQENWAQVSVQNEDKLDQAARQWLEACSNTMRAAMYDPIAGFTRATKEGDADFVAFGQPVLTARLNQARTNMQYRCHHLRDVAWSEDDAGQIVAVHRNLSKTAHELQKIYADKIHPKVAEFCKDIRQRFNMVRCRHIVMEAKAYKPAEKWLHKWVSIYVDVDNNHVLEETNVPLFEYVIPRWQTVSGSQYAYSPCTVAALPDARLIQAMTLVLLEAGEKVANPPWLATNDAVRGDINLYAGGITWTDRDYDERLGEAMRPLTPTANGIPFGMELRQDIKEQIMGAFYLNKINLPPMQGQMTAFEVSQRVQEYIRGALPLFEPMEVEYNGGLCMSTFEALMMGGAFGSIDNIPESLRGQDVKFKFKSPLQASGSQQKAKTLLEAKQIIGEGLEFDPSIRHMINIKQAVRSVLNDSTPADWVRSEQEVDDMAQEDANAAQQQQAMMQVAQGAQVAEQAGNAAQALSAAGVTPQQMQGV